MGQRTEAAADLRPGAVGAALVVGSAAILILGILPIVLGSLAAGGRLSQAGVGHAATLETIGIALGATAGPFWMERGGMRLKCALLSLVLTALNFAAPFAPDATVILGDRALAGLVSGLLLGAANVIIVRGRNPDRLSGIMLGASMVPQIAAAYLMPLVLVPMLGPGAGFYLLAGGALLAAISALAFPRRVAPIAVESPSGTARITPALLFFIAAIIVQNCGFGAAWAYVERIGHQHGFPDTLSGLAVSGSLACQVSAAWLSAWLSPRLPKWPVMLGLVTLQTGSAALLILGGAPWMFVLAVCVVGSVPPFMQPLQVAELIVLEPTRRAAALLAAMILVGTGLGPLATSLFMTDSDVYGGLWVAAGFIGVSVMLYGLAAAAPRGAPEAPALETDLARRPSRAA